MCKHDPRCCSSSQPRPTAAWHSAHWDPDSMESTASGTASPPQDLCCGQCQVGLRQGQELHRPIMKSARSLGEAPATVSLAVPSVHRLNALCQTWDGTRRFVGGAGHCTLLRVLLDDGHLAFFAAISGCVGIGKSGPPGKKLAAENRGGKASRGSRRPQ